MPLFRGQAYGEAVGEWWTTSEREAEKFAMSRGGNRTYVVLIVDVDDQDFDETGWLHPFLFAERSGDERGSWYRIPIPELRRRWRGVTIRSGSISLEPTPQDDFYAWYREEHTRLHKAWTKAVGTPGYNKNDWKSREEALNTEARVRAAFVGAEPPFLKLS